MTLRRYSAIGIGVCLWIGWCPPAAFAYDNFTVGYDANFTLLSTWDPATNKDVLLDYTSLDVGTVAVPFGSSLLIEGKQINGSRIVKYDATSGKVQTSWTANGGGIVSGYEFATDGTSLYTAFLNTIVRPGFSDTYNYQISKYDSGGSRAWTRTEAINVSQRLGRMVTDNGLLYVFGGAGSGWLMFATTTGTAITGKTEWMYASGALPTIGTNGGGGLAIGTASGNKYLYAVGAGGSGIARLVRYKFTGSVVSTTPDTTWNAQGYISLGTMSPAQMVVDSSGNIYITGYYVDGSTRYRYDTVKIDSSGNLLANISAPIDGTCSGCTNHQNVATSLALSPGNQYLYVTGKSYGPGSPTGDTFYTIKYNTSDLSVVSYNLSSFGLSEQPLGIAVASSGNVYITGYVPYDTVTGSSEPDLQAKTLTLSSSSIPLGTQSIMVSGEVQNVGAAISRPFTVQFCITPNANQWTECYQVPTGGDVSASTMAEESQALPANSTYSIPPTALSTAGLTGGTYYITMCADPYNVVTQAGGRNSGPTIGDDCKQTSLTIPTVTLSATSDPIDLGQSSGLIWSSSSDVTTCSGTGFQTGNLTNKSSPGVSVSPAGTSNYAIDCNNAAGVHAYSNTSVTVLHPTATITAAPAWIHRGDASAITWSAKDVTDCSVTKNGNATWGGSTWRNLPADGSGTVTSPISPVPSDTNTARATYVITCHSKTGDTPTATTYVGLISAVQAF